MYEPTFWRILLVCYINNLSFLFALKPSKSNLFPELFDASAKNQYKDNV